MGYKVNLGLRAQEVLGSVVVYQEVKPVLMAQEVLGSVGVRQAVRLVVCRELKLAVRVQEVLFLVLRVVGALCV